ncbi:TPA: winged helix-turn-helix domain-containing protein [Klebsiella oxytoca]|nr:winged helix-turn-helix domain-containing protein [Klebsiella oxytoca]
MRILVFADKALLRHHLKVQLTQQGHIVDDAQNVKEANYYIVEYPPDIAIIDLDATNEAGLALIRDWRGQGVSVPILVMSTGECWQDCVNALNAGADNHIRKPFHIDIMVARINALFRRNYGLSSELISIPPFLLNLSRRELSVNGVTLNLTAFEYIIMETLIRNCGKVTSKDDLMRQLYAEGELYCSSSLMVLIGRIRKKIRACFSSESIVTIRRQGYRFDIKK